jgi:hypothetical protein
VEVVDHGSLVLLDRVEGAGRHDVAGGLLIEPGWRVEDTADGWRLQWDAARLSVRLSGPVEHVREPRQQSPAYGRERPAEWLGWRWSGELPLEVRTELAPV